jgi:hypothetical protein
MITPGREPINSKDFPKVDYSKSSDKQDKPYSNSGSRWKSLGGFYAGATTPSREHPKRIPDLPHYKTPHPKTEEAEECKYDPTTQSWTPTGKFSKVR